MAAPMIKPSARGMLQREMGVPAGESMTMGDLMDKKKKAGGKKKSKPADDSKGYSE